jgi:Fe-S cluster biogenesis protein NfuA/nitrite reductase/ring-hydroxylating ferredoxin subunit
VWSTAEKSVPLNKEVDSRLSEAEALVQELETLPEGTAKRSAVGAIEALLALHGEGLERILFLLEEKGEHRLVEGLAADEVVAGLLLLHGLHPVPLEGRVRQALDKVRPYLGSHGGDVELLEVRDGSVHLRLQGSCDGCPSSEMTLKYAIERAINDAAPDVIAIDVAGVTPPKPAAGFIPLTQIRPVAKAEPGGGWQEAPGLSSLEPAGVRVSSVGGSRLAFCRVQDSWYAYRDACAACQGSLEGARLEAVVLACPGCGQRFDVRHAGRGLDDEVLHLEPVPLLVEGEVVRVAVAAAATP